MKKRPYIGKYGILESLYPDIYFGRQPYFLEIQLGYELRAFVENGREELLDDLRYLRNMMDIKYGIPVPPIHIRDNLVIAAEEYTISLYGREIEKEKIRIGYEMCIARPEDEISFTNTDNYPVKIIEPLWGLPAFLILDDDLKLMLKMDSLGFFRRSPYGILKTHILKCILDNRTKILNQTLVNQIINKVRSTNPDVINDIFVLHEFPISSMKKILNHLLADQYSIRDMNTILEAIADNINQSQEPEFLVEKVKEQIPGPLNKWAWYYWEL